MDVLLLFPHQLFRSNLTLARGKVVVLIEDALLFRQYAFHKQKLLLHRATMQMHAALLRKHGIRVEYIDSVQAPDMTTALRRVVDLQPDAAHFIDPVDDWLERRLLREAKRAAVKLHRHDTPMFLSSPQELRVYFDGRRMFMASFYADQRKRLNILMDGAKPVGGQWSFDADNRKRLPKSLIAPAVWQPPVNEFVREAAIYVDHHFPDSPGECDDFSYPVTYDDAQQWLDDFIANRLVLFGDYEDAISDRQSALFHSVLTPMLNIGLLTPRAVLDAVLAAQNIPLNSREGFVRQLIGWREYMRAAYLIHGRRQRISNIWGHQRPLPQAFWTATTGIEPIDTVIRRVRRHAYAHHIERLMVLANFMQLCGFDPDDIYRWFMEFFIDAYDWVMVPNVYGMALHADGGLIATKPYIAGSNYVRRMSDFKSGPWCDTWDALFWSFIARHRAFFAGNQRLRLMAQQLDRMPTSRRAGQERVATEFLDSLG